MPEGATFTGTLNSELGTAAIESGRIEGRRVRWAITYEVAGQAYTVTYAGEVDGTKIDGTVTAPQFGSFTFTGEKRP